MKDHLQETLQVELDNETITYPPIDICNGDFFFLPFNMKVGNGLLKSALATPLCVLRNARDTYIFYTDNNPQYLWEKEPKDADVVTISREDALNAWKICKDKEYLLITKNDIIETKTGYQIITSKPNNIKSFPQLQSDPEGYRYKGVENGFYIYEFNDVIKDSTVTCTLLRTEEDKKYYELEIDYAERINDCFIHIDFGGNQAKLYIENECVDDWFYTGQTWEIGMKRFNYSKKVVIEVQALREDDKIFLEKWPIFNNGIACEIYKAEAKSELVYQLNINK